MTILDFKLSPCFGYCEQSFGCIPGVLIFVCRRFGTIYLFHLQRQDMKYIYPAFEDGTDRWFRNVGTQKSDAGDTPKILLTRMIIVFSL
jgi:hypothetical protein